MPFAQEGEEQEDTHCPEHLIIWIALSMSRSVAMRRSKSSVTACFLLVKAVPFARLIPLISLSVEFLSLGGTHLMPAAASERCLEPVLFSFGCIRAGQVRILW